MAALCITSSHAIGQTYPSKPVRMIVGFPPGGGADTIARVVSGKLSERIKQAVIVDNRPGAGGMAATLLVAKAAPDGYNLLLTNANFATNPALYEKTVRYDAVREFAPITLLGASQYLLTVTPALGVTSVKELLASAKTRPGKINVASAGLGGPGHLSAELLRLLTGVELVHVPYKGTGPIVTSLLSNETQMVFGNMGAMVPLVHAQRLRGLAVSGAMRSVLAPEFPTMAEAGVSGFEVSSWYGVLAPAGASSALINLLHQETARAVQTRDVADKLASAGLEIRQTTPDQFTQYIRAEIPKWKKVARLSGIQLEETR